MSNVYFRKHYDLSVLSTKTKLMINERFECEILRYSRTRLLHLMETIDYEILFKIPEGFNNNIIWEIGHCITSQQRHMYMCSGLTKF